MSKWEETHMVTILLIKLLYCKHPKINLLIPMCIFKLLIGLGYPLCTDKSSSVANNGLPQRLWLQYLLYRNYEEKLQYVRPKLTDDISFTVLKDLPFNPCESNYMTEYLNLKEVKKALHIPNHIIWQRCSTVLNYTHTDFNNDMTHLYKYIIDHNPNLNILIYSGDDDSLCSTLGTQEWIWDLKYNVSSTFWQTYHVDRQPAGYLTTWKDVGLAFMTVHGAGHEVRTV